MIFPQFDTAICRKKTTLDRWNRANRLLNDNQSHGHAHPSHFQFCVNTALAEQLHCVRACFFYAFEAEGPAIALLGWPQRPVGESTGMG